MEVFVSEVESTSSVFGLLGACCANYETVNANSLLCFIEAEKTGLAAATDNENLLVQLAELCSLCRSTCNVECGERAVFSGISSGIFP